MSKTRCFLKTSWVDCQVLTLVSSQIVRTLCLFLTPSERKCSRLCRADSSFKYDTGLFVQGLLKVATSPLSLYNTMWFESEPGYSVLPSLLLWPDFSVWPEIVAARYFYCCRFRSLLICAAFCVVLIGFLVLISRLQCANSDTDISECVPSVSFCSECISHTVVCTITMTWGSSVELRILWTSAMFRVMRKFNSDLLPFLRSERA